MAFMDEAMIMQLAQALVDMNNPTRIDDLNEALALLNDPAYDFSDYPNYSDCVAGIKHLLSPSNTTQVSQSSTDAISQTTDDTDPAKSDMDIHLHSTDSNNDDPVTATVDAFQVDPFQGGAGSTSYELPADFPVPQDDLDSPAAKETSDRDYTLVVPSDEIDEDDDESYLDDDESYAEDDYLPSDYASTGSDTDPYAMTPVDDDDTYGSSSPSLEDAIASTSSTPNSPLSSSAPTVTAPPEDDNTKSFALFDDRLPKERRDVLLSMLQNWYDHQIQPMHLPLPSCLLQHAGPLVATYALFGEFTHANMVAKKDFRAYTPYSVALNQFIAQTVSAHGIWTAELSACLTAKSHVTPDSEKPPQEVVAYNPHKVAF